MSETGRRSAGDPRRWLVHQVSILAVGALTAVAVGCFGLVVGLAPSFMVERLLGWPAPAWVTIGLSSVGALAAAAWGAGPSFKRLGETPPPAPQHRRTVWQAITGRILPRPPPWHEPRTLSPFEADAKDLAALHVRLDPVPVGETELGVYQGRLFRDRETGQYWEEQYVEQGFFQGHQLVPIEEARATALIATTRDKG